MRADLVDKLTASIYDAVLNSDGWDIALRYFTELTDGTGACLVFGDPRMSSANIAHFVGHSPESIRQYNDYYFAHDPLVELAAHTPPGIWINDWRDTPGRPLHMTEFYNDFMRTHDTHAAMAALLIHDDDVIASISVQRALRQREFSQADQDRADVVLPHIQRAVRLHRRMHQLGIRQAVGYAALDHVSVPIFITDSRAALMLSNRAAEDLLRGSRMFSVMGGRVMVADRGREMEQAIAAAASPGGGRATGIRLVDRENGTPFHLLITPLSERSIQFGSWREPMALIVVHHQGTIRPSIGAMLRGLYGLTPAEARVAQLLAGGMSPSEASVQLGVTVATARSQIKAIYAKTGIRRQSDLCRLVGKMELI